MRARRLVLAAMAGGAAAALAAAGVTAGPATSADAGAGMTSQVAHLPNVPGLITTHKKPSTACTLPDGSDVAGFHCYTPQQIRKAYGVTKVARANQGKGQTIVLVDAYGSPTATADLDHFQETFYPGRPAPDFQQVFPQGNPQYKNSCVNSKGKAGKGLSGPCAAAGWSGEATLDIEWAYSIAPKAHIILLAVPPAETLGVQGLPNLFRAISHEIDATPRGTVFSMSFAVAEQTFGGAAAAQTAKFDKVFQKGIARHDNFFAAAGDTGTSNAAKQKNETAVYPNPTVQWPASSPYVVAVGGTQLQYGWTWDPTSNTPFSASTASGLNPGYWHSTPGGETHAVWNESWAPIATGGGASAIYPEPAWQKKAIGSPYGNHRVLPDTSWNAAVNGGVDVYISAYPQYNCGNATGCWNVYGGTSAATPQTAALVALANAARNKAGEKPLGFLDPILYSSLGGTSAYSDVRPVHEGSAPKSFAGSDVHVVGTVHKSAGDLVDNQLWQVSTPGYATTPGYDATTGWGVPNAANFVAALVKH